MALYAGDKGPAKAISITIATGTVSGLLVSSVRLRIRRPDGTEDEWSPSVSGATASSVSLSYALESDGSSVPLEGTYFVRGWCYSSLGAMLLDTDESVFRVQPSRHQWPT